MLEWWGLKTSSIKISRKRSVLKTFAHDGSFLCWTRVTQSALKMVSFVPLAKLFFMVAVTAFLLQTFKEQVEGRQNFKQKWVNIYLPAFRSATSNTAD